MLITCLLLVVLLVLMRLDLSCSVVTEGEPRIETYLDIISIASDATEKV